jgi:hypothetical protein
MDSSLPTLTMSFPPLAEIRMKTHSVFKIHHLGMNDARPLRLYPNELRNAGLDRHHVARIAAAGRRAAVRPVSCPERR